MDISKFTDTTNYSSMWYVIHTMACSATTDKLKESFEVYINNLCNRFPCDTCKAHFREFIDSHPFYKYWAIYDIDKNDIGFYKWTWELHNSVNLRLKKKKVGLEESYVFYSSNTTVCGKNCGS